MPYALGAGYLICYFNIMNLKITAVLVIIFGVGLFLGVFWYFSNQEDKSNEVNAVIFNKAVNPLEETLPKTNPFEARLNPFEGVYKNPFDQLR